MQSLFGNCLRSLVLILTSGLIAGCGGGAGADRPDRTPVSGSVMFAGSPVSGATVMFAPSDEGAGRAATGITDDAGKFVMGTFEKADGAVPGDYVVLISKFEQSTANSAGQISEDDPAYNGAPVEEETEAEPKSLIPAEFGQRASSTLTATVGADPVEDLKFDLGG